MAKRATLVLDIGKSNAKLLLIDAQGEVLRSLRLDNQSQPDAAHGYTALGTERLAAWLQSGVKTLLQGVVPGRISVTTHGAAFCALGDEGLVLPPIDYEWDGYGNTTAAFEASLGDFSHHGTPRLPLGLNAGRQLDFVHRQWPTLARDIRCWLPYPQYWAWWFSGIACSEVSSLGCHTGLWAPAGRRFSDWAVASGLAERFAPLRAAWDVIGTLRPELAAAWNLPGDVEVIAGAHDSNACLARYLHALPNATVVSTGTWCVVMAPGAQAARLMPEHDELINVAVDGRPVPTARFMGGREFAVLCGGSDPSLATAENLSEVLRQGWMALPCFSMGGGPYAGRPGQVLRDGDQADAGIDAVPPALRPALAALYCANLSALLVNKLAGGATDHPVIIEGPLAHNAAYCSALAALIPDRCMLRSTDPLEGTARGAWRLAHWTQPLASRPDELLAPLPAVAPALADAVRSQASAWRQRVERG